MPEPVEHFCPVGYKREFEVSQAVESNNEKHMLPTFGYFYYLLNSPPKTMTLRTPSHLGRGSRTGSVPACSWLVSLERRSGRPGWLC